jgi:hypothetical protein
MRTLLPALLLLAGCLETRRTQSSDVAGQLVVEPVDLANPKRLSHGVIAFASNPEHAQAALEAHRSRKEETIAELPPPSGVDPGLYLIWGDFPKPSLAARDIKAHFDGQRGRVIVTLPPWSGEKPDKGIGMDWRTADRSSWTFVGYRVKLSKVPAGERSYEVREVDGDKSRVLAEGTFKLQR